MKEFIKVIVVLFWTNFAKAYVYHVYETSETVKKMHFKTLLERILTMVDQFWTAKNI